MATKADILTSELETSLTEAALSYADACRKPNEGIDIPFAHDALMQASYALHGNPMDDQANDAHQTVRPATAATPTKESKEAYLDRIKSIAFDYQCICDDADEGNIGAATKRSAMECIDRKFVEAASLLKGDAP